MLNEIRQTWAVAIELRYVAARRFGAFIVPWVNTWDVAAGTLIVKETYGLATPMAWPFLASLLFLLRFISH